MMIEYGNNAVREQQAADAAAGTKQDHALVRKLWVIKGQSDRFHVQRIAERSWLPVKWLSAPPSINGERGMDKLMEEWNVLLLRDRKSPFIEQFQHPLGRCAKFYKLTAYNNCNFWCEYCAEGKWFADCRGRKIAISEGMQNRDVPRDCGWDSPLQQEGSDCSLQGDAAGLENDRFGRERTELQLYGLMYYGIALEMTCIY
jgi:hypothetical protein